MSMPYIQVLHIFVLGGQAYAISSYCTVHIMYYLIFMYLLMYFNNNMHSVESSKVTLLHMYLGKRCDATTLYVSTWVIHKNNFLQNFNFGNI